MRSFALPVVLLSLSLRAHAAFFASAVVSFDQGGGSSLWNDPAATLGAPAGLTGENPNASNFFNFPNVLSPFSGAYQGDEIFQIGEGGQLTIRLARYAIVGPGKRIGVFTNAGLFDSDYSNAINSTPASAFGGGKAIVKVSEDNQNWVSLGEISFNIPNLFYTNAGPYDTIAPSAPQLADFGVPFPGTLASFDGADWSATLAAFKVGNAYSAGGTWLDLSATGLTQVGYIQFSIADDGDNLTGNTLAIDAVSIANGAEGAQVPEPATLSLLTLAAAALLPRRRR